MGGNLLLAKGSETPAGEKVGVSFCFGKAGFPELGHETKHNPVQLGGVFGLWFISCPPLVQRLRVRKNKMDLDYTSWT